MSKLSEIKVKREKKKEEEAKVEPEPEPEKKSLKQEILELKEVLLTGGKKKYKDKPFRLPAKIRARAKRAAQKNKILVFLLKSNRGIVPTIGQMSDGMVYIGDKVHNASLDFIWLYKYKIPALVIPEWSLVPIGTKDYYEAVDKNKIIDPQTIIIRAIEAKESEMSKKILSGKFLLWIVLVGAAVAYILFSNK